MWKPNRHNGKVAQWRGNSIKVDKMKICYIWVGERGPPWPPLWSSKGSKAQKRNITAWCLDKNLFFFFFFNMSFTKIYMRKWKLLQYCKDTTSAKSVSRLRNLWRKTWSACVQTLTLGDRTCCCCLSQQWRESSNVSYLGKKNKKKKQKMLSESKA